MYMTYVTAESCADTGDLAADPYRVDKDGHREGQTFRVLLISEVSY